MLVSSFLDSKPDERIALNKNILVTTYQVLDTVLCDATGLVARNV